MNPGIMAHRPVTLRMVIRQGRLIPPVQTGPNPNSTWPFQMFKNDQGAISTRPFHESLNQPGQKYVLGTYPPGFVQPLEHVQSI